MCGKILPWALVLHYHISFVPGSAHCSSALCLFNIALVMNEITTAFYLSFQAIFPTIAMEICTFHFRTSMVQGGNISKYLTNLLGNYERGRHVVRTISYNYGLWYINLVCISQIQTMGIIKIHFGHCVENYGPVCFVQGSALRLLDGSLTIGWRKHSWNPERVSSVDYSLYCVCRVLQSTPFDLGTLF